MTSLDGWAESVRGSAAKVQLPKLSTIVVTLIGLLPFLLGWTINAVWQFLRLLKAAFVSGWERGETRMGPTPRTPGGS